MSFLRKIRITKTGSIRNGPLHFTKCLTTLPHLRNKSIASFDDVKSVSDSPEKALIIDVREPSELQETGVIPNSINIPLGDVENVLKNMSPEEFQKKYNRPKPNLKSSIIFSCKLGKRGAQAQEAAVKLGFENTKNYQGGWVDWEEKIKQN